LETDSTSYPTAEKKKKKKKNTSSRIGNPMLAQSVLVPSDSEDEAHGQFDHYKTNKFSLAVWLLPTKQNASLV
jgi:hypothetical protein